MAPPPVVSSESDEDFHSVTRGREGRDARSAVAQGMASTHEEFPPSPPQHPLKSMQGPFEESIVESNLHASPPTSRANAELRRQRLLDAARFDESLTTRWKQIPNAEHHPLLKLMAQIIFGMHLLQQNQAKSDSEVVKILQHHVDEVDNFLEQTAEDFDLAIRDIDERIRFLQLPMQHVKVFNIMLDDKQFRTQLLDGNEKIERIIDRTARAMNAALLDVQRGRQATRELSKYLNSVQYIWPTDKSDLEAIYTAMRGNEEGWKKCYKDLQTKGNHLGNKLIELGTIIGEMSRMAAAASRRVGSQARPRSSGTSSVASSKILRSRFNPEAMAANRTTPSKEKPLPRAPSTTPGAERTSVPKTRPVSFHQRFENPREIVPIPPKLKTDTDQRPRTSSGESSATNPRKTTGALSSHPPEAIRPHSAGNDRASVTPRAKSGLRESTLRAVSVPPSNPETNNHARVASTASPSGRKRDSFFFPSRDAIAGTSFARRWSIRKKFPGPKPEDYVSAPEPKLKRDPANKSATSNLKSPSQIRLATVLESPGRGGNQAQAQKHNILTGNLANDSTAALDAVPIPCEPKSRIDSDRLSQSRIRQSMLSTTNNAASVDPSTAAPSIASSIKRRTLSIRGLFSKRGRGGPVAND